MQEMSEKKRRIVEAAMEVFSNHPYHQVKVDQIAERAGVGKGTIYEYFSSKDDLFLSVADAGGRMYFLDIVSALSDKQSASEKLKGFFWQHMRFIEKHAAAARILLSERRAPHPDIKKMLLEGRRQLISLVEALLAEGIAAGEFRDISPSAISHAVMGTLSALWFSVLFEEVNVTDAEKMVGSILDFYLNGLRP